MTSPRESGSSPGPAEDDAKLRRELSEILGTPACDRDQLRADLAALVSKHGVAVYKKLVFVLSHLHFDADEAKRHWEQISALHQTMCERLDVPIDVRAALAAYFLTVEPSFENPVLIESAALTQAQASTYRDELTGLYNFRYFSEHLAREVQRSNRFSIPVSLLMI
ncbi:GGDEF domain-containing protein, partial [Planctomycetota bacterium]